MRCELTGHLLQPRVLTALHMLNAWKGLILIYISKFLDFCYFTSKLVQCYYFINYAVLSNIIVPTYMNLEGDRYSFVLRKMFTLDILYLLKWCKIEFNLILVHSAKSGDHKYKLAFLYLYQAPVYHKKSLILYLLVTKYYFVCWEK